MRIPCTLVPLTTGSLSLPGVQIKVHSTSMPHPNLTSPTSPMNQAITSSLIHAINKSSGQQVLVTPRTRSATLYIFDKGQKEELGVVGDLSDKENHVGFQLLGYGSLRREKAISIDTLMMP